MYLRQKCPHCAKEAEFVYEMIGHHISCKHCNLEFTLEGKKFNFLPYLIWTGILLIIGVAGYFALRAFHDWWIYR